ncbi:MAG: DUF1684 domain-containing protein [Solirubrobacteraceae bacterium]
MTEDTILEAMTLLDWRRRVAQLYADVRADRDLEAAWNRWHQTRSALFREHQQSPIPSSTRSSYSGPYVYANDPAWRVLARVQPVAPARFELATSNVEVMAFRRRGLAHFQHGGSDLSLELYWLEGYGGGLFVPFADATSGQETYGAGRYLLDTVKGADLGEQDGRLVLDFNYAYQPSCSYDPRWTCPLAPPANRLPLAVRAGERLTAE